MTESIDKSSQKESNEKKSDNDYNYEILDEDYSEYDLAFKLIVIGNAGVGKSCLSLRATKNFFNNDYSSTIGFEYFKFNVKLKTKEDDNIIRLHIWDTCGQEIYRSLVSNYYKNSSLAILVYSIDE
jgi:Ras-related protein Rab-1A